MNSIEKKSDQASRLKIVEYNNEIKQLNWQLQQEIANRQSLEKQLQEIQKNGQDQDYLKTQIELRKRVGQQSAIAKLSQIGLGNQDLSAFMKEAVELVAQTLEVEYCQILQFRADLDSLINCANFGYSQEKKHCHIIPNTLENQAGYTLQNGQPVIIENWTQETRFQKIESSEKQAIVSGVSLTIPGETAPFGVLVVDTEKNHNFSEDDLKFLQAIANVIAATIQRYYQQEKLYLLERAINGSSNGIVITDALTPHNPITYVNSGFEGITGYKSQEVIGLNCNFLQQDDTDQPGLEELRQAIKEGRESQITIRNYRKDGTLFWNELYVSPIYNSENILTHFIGFQTDITERKCIEEALQLTQFSLDRATDSVFWLHSSGYFIYVNDAACNSLGYTREELLILKSSAVGQFAPTNIPLNNSHNGRKSFTFEAQHKNKEGQVFPVEISANYLNFNGQEYNCAFVRDITERKKAEKALRDSQEQLTSILNSLEDVVWSASVETSQYLYLNPTAEKVYGRSLSEFCQNSQLWLEVIHHEDRDFVASVSQKLVTDRTNKDVEYRIVRPNGEIRWLRDRARLICDDTGKPIRIDGIGTDITDQKLAEDALRKSEEQIRLTFELAPIGMAITKLDGKFIEVNQSLCKALGYESEELLKLNFDRITHPDDIAADLGDIHKLLTGEIYHFKTEKRLVSKDGEIVHTIFQIVVIRDREGKALHLVNQVVDITERKRMEERLLHDAFHDMLTGLPNRSLFMDRLKQAIKRTERNPEYLFAVLFLDLDNFKVVNDSVGHLIGDQLLIAIAHKLQLCLRPTDTVARLGGDEFIILLEDLSNEYEAIKVAERIEEGFKLPFNVNGNQVFSSVSIGITRSSIGYDRPEDVLRDVDISMYQAKDQGKSRYEIFNRTMHTHTLQRLELETDLRRAIERQEFLVYYQPIINFKTGKITEFEALIRWISPSRGFVSPGHFIPIAEETGLIVPIGEWVLYEACCQLNTWRFEFPEYSDLTISVNLSGRQLRERNLLERIDYILSQTGLNQEYLKLEITESMLMDNLDSVNVILQELRKRKIKLSIDDFGTGYSSLSYLHSFPVNTLKIDRTFVNPIGSSGENSEIARAIISLAHTLGMDVVAEGIETQDHFHQLKKIDCEKGQGYFFAKPLDKQAIEKLLETCPVWD
jgi:diguanylate cyclase (GGDEF)-like protein/PAS domain S-box-containing protein